MVGFQRTSSSFSAFCRPLFGGVICRPVPDCLARRNCVCARWSCVSFTRRDASFSKLLYNLFSKRSSVHFSEWGER
jgi:hypothetical protein